MLAHAVHYVLDPQPYDPSELAPKVAGHPECLPHEALCRDGASAYLASPEAHDAGHRTLRL
jgi:hypothetical protein